MLGLELDRGLVLGDGEFHLLERVEKHAEIEVRVNVPRIDLDGLFVREHLLSRSSEKCLLDG
jgi:hypothetical protein